MRPTRTQKGIDCYSLTYTVNIANLAALLFHHRCLKYTMYDRSDCRLTGLLLLLLLWPIALCKSSKCTRFHSTSRQKFRKWGYRDEAALTWDFEKKKTQIALAWCSSKTLWYATCDENMPKIGGLVFFFEISYQSCPPKSTPKNQFCWSITNFGKPLAPLDSLPQNCPKTHVPIVCKCLPPSPSPNSCTVFLLYFPLSAYLHISQNDEILLAILNKR